MLQAKSHFRKIGRSLYLLIPDDMSKDSMFPFAYNQKVLLTTGQVVGTTHTTVPSMTLTVTGL